MIFALFFMACVACYLFSGWQLLRCLCWLLLWQIATPLRSLYLDIPLLVLGFCITEWAFLLLTSRFKIKP